MTVPRYLRPALVVPAVLAGLVVPGSSGAWAQEVPAVPAVVRPAAGSDQVAATGQDGHGQAHPASLSRGTWVASGGRWYYRTPDGASATGWVQDSGSWYYLDSTGAMVTGWLPSGGSWYYLGASGAMVRGWIQVGSSWYYLDSVTGAMATGWLQIGSQWYFLDSTGAMVTGWLPSNGSWYWLGASGAMVTGTVQIQGQWSGFTSSGAWTGYLNGWVLDGWTYTRYVDGVATASQTLRPVMTAPTASRDVLIATMTSAYAASGCSYPAWALTAGGAGTPQEFFAMVYDEAVAEGVSPELLFAQVMKETGWLQFTGDVAVEQFNFGGIGATGGGAAGNWFPDVRTGLRAQVQHLRAYADPQVTPGALAHAVVDPRFAYVHKGSASYVQYLGIQENPARAGWAAARYYGMDLVDMINQYF